LTSSAFRPDEQIPVDYTCDGKNVSPPLQWSGIPSGTKSLALMVDDPDASSGAWTHWIVFNLPADRTDLPEAVPAGDTAPGNALQGRNDFKNVGYGGPCPPPGKAHHYYFRLYALDLLLDVKPGATKKEMEAAMAKHVLGQAQLMGTYRRK